MPRRTADANKAVLAAWEREQALVREGKGTRDWTPEQQKDILDPDCGKAYDDNGKAFEGQHMKSVEKYPEYQGNPDNIQFLTREEHINAHKGSWKNPTNWYYDPVTKQFFDFGENELIPCTIICLNNPIVQLTYYNVDAATEGPDPFEEVLHSGTDPPAKDSTHPIKEGPPGNRQASNIPINQVSKSTMFSRFVTWGEKTAKHLWQNHKGEIIALALSLATAAWDAVVSSKNNSEDQVSPMSDSSVESSRFVTECDFSAFVTDNYLTSSEKSDDSLDEKIMKAKRKSPEEHTVNDQGQRYHYKDGSVRYKEKQPYKRGKPKGEE